MAYTGEGRYLEAFLEWKGPKCKNFQRVWTVLQHTAVYFYQNRTTDLRESVRNQQTPLACAHIDDKTVFAIDKKDELKFTIDSTQGIHRCKVKKTEEVDLWRAYVVSFSKRTIPQDISQTILPGQRNDIYRALEQEFSLEGRAPPPVPESARPKRNLRGSCSSTGSGSSTEQRLGRLSMSSTGSGSSFKSQDQEQSGDIRYYPDHMKDIHEPTWFFQKISRTESEEILENNKDKGDILIRKSERYAAELVLSAMLFVSGRHEIRHYRIKKQGKFFILDIDEKHPPILNLYELLNYFIHKTGGYPVLRPLVTNDLRQLKLPPHLYERGFITRADKDPDSGEWGPKPIPPEIYEQADYLLPEEPEPIKQQHGSSPAPSSTQSYTKQDQTQKPPVAAPAGPRQLIPRPQVTLGSGKQVPLDKPIPAPGAKVQSTSQPDTPSEGECYYNADAIQLHQHMKMPKPITSSHPSDLMYQNQPPLPPSNRDSPVNCGTVPAPPPVHTIPMRKRSTSQAPSETQQQQLQAADELYQTVASMSQSEHMASSKSEESNAPLCQQVASAIAGLKPVNKRVQQQTQAVSQQAQALTNELANALARRKKATEEE